MVEQPNDTQHTTSTAAVDAPWSGVSPDIQPSLSGSIHYHQSHLDSASEEEVDLTDGPLFEPEPSYAAAPMSLISGSNRPFSIHNMLDPNASDRHVKARMDGAKHADAGDLITRGVLSVDMAFQLFSLWVPSLHETVSVEGLTV
jgi:hypothetical protein